MTHTFTTHFHIRQYEVNAHGELPNGTLLRLFQETAMRATQDAGYGVEWFNERHTVWVIHKMTLEHLRPMRYPGELAITTWLSDIQRVRTHREYLARDAATNEIVARGRCHWAHLHGDTLFPVRIPTDIIERFAPNGVRAVPRLEPRVYPMPTALTPIEFHAMRRVQRYEADGLQHVNNAIYVDWFEETLADAVASHASILSSHQWASRLCVRRHDIEYARSALPGDTIEIVARLTGAGHCASAWSLEVKRGAERLACDRITAFWVDSQGRPVRSE